MASNFFFIFYIIFLFKDTVLLGSTDPSLVQRLKNRHKKERTQVRSLHFFFDKVGQILVFQIIFQCPCYNLIPAFCKAVVPEGFTEMVKILKTFVG